MIILKTPFSKGSLGKNMSSNSAPDKIIEQTNDIYLNESGFAFNLNIDSIDVDNDNIVATNQKIADKLKHQGFRDKVCLLGGDHSITYPAFKAFAEKHPGAGLIILDAHPDCEAETEPPSHEDFVRYLVKQGIVAKDRLILFGLRNMTGNEKQFLDDNKIKYFTMKQINMTGLSDVIDGLTETVRTWPALYLSIDIDVADPACAPGTGYIEPGGLTARQLIYLIQRLKLLKNLKMVDIVEVGPDKDINDMTSKLAAKLLVELA